MKNPRYKVLIFVLSLASCANPIHVKRSQLEVSLDKKIGRDFSAIYPVSMQDKLTNETVNYKEYTFNKNQPCSWVVKVDKKSNTVESWKFLPPDGCYD